MFQKLFTMFTPEQAKTKPTSQLFVQYKNKDPETGKIDVQIMKYDHELHPQYDGWKRIKYKSLDRNQIYANLGKDNFIDPDFPHTNESISAEKSQIVFEWKRIPDFIDFCIYVSAGTCQNFQRMSITSKRLKQALLLMYRTHPNKFKQLLAKDTNQKGLYQYKLYKHGVIENIIIDDYVPVVNRVHPLMVGPVAQKQIFPMLIQKAIAKICGAYDQIPESLDQLCQILFCGPLRRTKVEELSNTEMVSNTVENTLKNGGVTAFISKSSQKIRSLGISENQIYHIMNKYNVSTTQQQNLALYELVSEKKMSSWNGRYSHNDGQWGKINSKQKSILFNSLKVNKSFFVSEKDISKIFDHLIAFDGTDIANKQWIELSSEAEYPSFATFQLTERDTIFLRVTTQDTLRISLILAQQTGDNSYKYINGAFYQNSSSVELTQQLKKGKYIICSYHDWILNKTGIYSIFMSSNSQCLLFEAQENEYPSFLQYLFKDYSEMNKMVKPTPSFFTIKNCYTIGMMTKQIGFAFIHFCLSGTNQKQVNIEIKPKVLAQQNWQILEPNAGRTTIHLQNGINSQLIIILKIQKDLQLQNPQFPTTAFKIQI